MDFWRHSTTTWTKSYPILTIYPPQMGYCGYFKAPFVNLNKCGLSDNLHTYLFSGMVESGGTYKLTLSQPGGGGRLWPPNYYNPPPRFSDLLTSLLFVYVVIKYPHFQISGRISYKFIFCIDQKKIHFEIN